MAKNKLAKQTLSLHLGSAFCAFPNGSVFSYRSYAVFTRPTSTIFNNFFFKTRSHGIIHTFKNYFAIVFSTINLIKQTSVKVKIDELFYIGWGLSPVSSCTKPVEIMTCVHFWTRVTISMSPAHWMHWT